MEGACREVIRFELLFMRLKAALKRRTPKRWRDFGQAFEFFQVWAARRRRSRMPSHEAPSGGVSTRMSSAPDWSHWCSSA